MDSGFLFCGFFLPCRPNGLPTGIRPVSLMSRLAFTSCQRWLALDERKRKSLGGRRSDFRLRINDGKNPMRHNVTQMKRLLTCYCIGVG